MRIVGIAGSPRRGGNTDTLLDEFLSVVPTGSHSVKRIVAPLAVKPCLACDKCLSGECIQKDAMQDIYSILDESDLLILAAPIYFYSLPGHVKMMIDRSQLFYNRKFVLRKDAGHKKKGVFLSCGATAGAKLFDGAILTVKYWFESLDCEYLGNALFRHVDGKGDILKNPSALTEIRALAARCLSS